MLLRHLYLGLLLECCGLAPPSKHASRTLAKVNGDACATAQNWPSCSPRIISSGPVFPMHVPVYSPAPATSSSTAFHPPGPPCFRAGQPVAGAPAPRSRMVDASSQCDILSTALNAGIPTSATISLASTRGPDSSLSQGSGDSPPAPTHARHKCNTCNRRLMTTRTGHLTARAAGESELSDSRESLPEADKLSAGSPAGSLYAPDAEPAAGARAPALPATAPAFKPGARAPADTRAPKVGRCQEPGLARGGPEGSARCGEASRVCAEMGARGAVQAGGRRAVGERKALRKKGSTKQERLAVRGEGRDVSD